MSTPTVPVIRPRPRATDGVLEFWWGPPVSDGGSAVTGYVFDIPGVITDTLSPSVGYYKVTGLVNGDPYTATIYATNANGNGATATFRTVEPGNPPAPLSSVTTTRDASGAATFSWTAPASDGGATIGWNKLSLIPLRSDLPTKLYNTLAADTTLSITDLSANESYIPLVEARNDPGFSVPKRVLTNTLTFGTRPQDLSGYYARIDSSDLSYLFYDTSGQERIGYNSAVDVNSWYSDFIAFARVNTRARFLKRGMRIGTGPYYPAVSFQNPDVQGFETISTNAITTQNEISIFALFEFVNTTTSGQYLLYAYSAALQIYLDLSRGTNILINADDNSTTDVPYTSGPVFLGIFSDLSNTSVEVYYPTPQTFTVARANSIDYNTNTTWGLGQNAVDVRISEMDFFGKIVSGADKAAIKTYYQRKWGVISLPDPVVYFVGLDLTDGASTWTDRSANSYDASLAGGTSSKLNTNALYLDGSSYWTFADIGLLTNFSVTTWFKRTAAIGSGGSIVSEAYTGGNYVNLAIYGGAYGATDTEFVGGFFSGSWNIGAPQTFALNTWVQMTVTWDGTDVKTYINGALVDTTNYSGQTTGSTGLGYRIGRRWDNPDYVTGELGELRIDSVALTDAQVSLYYNSTSATYTNAPPPTATWTERTSAGTRNWWAVASSSNGTKLAAADQNGYIYTSTDSGVTWTEQTGSGTRFWFSMASSADGSVLVAVVYNAYIHTSTDSGVTWTEHTSGLFTLPWYSVACSADGTFIIAAAAGGSEYLYYSTNTGANWTAATDAGTHNWVGVASSSDGVKLAAVANGGYIYTSTNSGVNWTQRTGSGSRSWRAIASSSDGTKLAAVVEGGYIYTSTDSGVTWTQQSSAGSGSWVSITSSADGVKLAAVVYVGAISISTDSGATWTVQNSPGTANWISIASSSNGNKLITGAYSASIWTYA